jgi:Resolvase, N terminal domain
MTKNIKCVLYIPYSDITDKARQISNCTAQVLSEEWEVFCEFYDDEIIKRVSQRRMFRKMLEYVKSNDIKYVVVDSIYSLAATIEEAGYMLGLIESKGAGIYIATSPESGFESNEKERLIYHVLSHNFNEQGEIDYIAE